LASPAGPASRLSKFELAGRRLPSSSCFQDYAVDNLLVLELRREPGEDGRAMQRARATGIERDEEQDELLHFRRCVSAQPASSSASAQARSLILLRWKSGDDRMATAAIPRSAPR